MGDLWLRVRARLIFLGCQQRTDRKRPKMTIQFALVSDKKILEISTDENALRARPGCELVQLANSHSVGDTVNSHLGVEVPNWFHPYDGTLEKQPLWAPPLYRRLGAGESVKAGTIVTLLHGTGDSRRTVSYFTADNAGWVTPETANGFWYGVED